MGFLIKQITSVNCLRKLISSIFIGQEISGLGCGFVFL